MTPGTNVAYAAIAIPVFIAICSNIEPSGISLKITTEIHPEGELAPPTKQNPGQSVTAGVRID